MWAIHAIRRDGAIFRQCTLNDLSTCNSDYGGTSTQSSLVGPVPREKL